MCLSSAYMFHGDNKELLAEEVASVEFHESTIVLRTLFGEEKKVAGRVRQVDLLNHVILLERD